MVYVTYMFMFGLILGLAAVASNPSPYFGALGLVLAAGMGCGMLASYEGSFLSLVLFLIYLGGMLVVFAYSAALAAEPFPEGWGSWSVLGVMVGYIGSVGAANWYWSETGHVSLCEFEVGCAEFIVSRADTGGVAMMYSMGGGLLLLAAWVLLLTLFVVLELTRGGSRGTLRAV